MQIIHPVRAQRKELFALWEEAFGADVCRERFFAELFCEKNSLCAVEAGAVIGVIHTVPYVLYTPNGEQQARYLYGVATKKECRGRGVFTALHERLVQTADCDCLFLIPETIALRSFYRKFGYVDAGWRAESARPNVPLVPLTAECAWERYRALAHKRARVFLDEVSFAITAIDKCFWFCEETQELWIQEGEVFTSFDSLAGEVFPTAMVLPLGTQPVESFVLPCLLN